MLKRQFGVILSIFILWGNISLAAEQHKMAVIFPGAIQDRDYNMIGHQAMRHVESLFGMETAYSQRVSSEDAEEAISRHYVKGFKIIWTHGGQYNSLVMKISHKYPDAIFIIEGDEPMKTTYPNIIVLGGSEYHKSYYVLGALAAKLTKTGHVGYIGGIELPFTYGEINAASQAVRDYQPHVRLHFMHVGDFNDPLKTRLVAEALIAQKCDVLLSGVNLGNFGLFEAVRKAPRKVFFTTTYTSKHGYAPDRYLCSDIVNYIPPIEQVVRGIIRQGVRSGYYPVSWGEGKARYINFPIYNISKELNDDIRQIGEQVATGKITVSKILEKIIVKE